jgi:hypothetical protein
MIATPGKVNDQGPPERRMGQFVITFARSAVPRVTQADADRANGAA